jgi:MFS family permease
MAGTQTSLVALIVDRTPEAELGSAMATYSVAWDVGAVIGSVMLGFVAGVTGYGGVFAICAVFPLLGLLVFVTRVRSASPAALSGELDAAGG